MEDYSVLMSVYDQDDRSQLEEGIDSMLEQTAPPEQFVIVEDGEVHEDVDLLIRYYEGCFPELFTVVRLSENGGLAHALNRGLDVCRNELVARMDADDISMPDRCESELAEFRRDPDIAITGTYADEFCEDPEKTVSVRKVPLTEDEIVRFARRRNPFNHPSVMFRKSVIASLGGYDERFRRAQDYDLFSRMVFSGCRGRNIDRSLLKLRADAAQLARRRSLEAGMAHVRVVRGLWKSGHATLADLLAVFFGECLLTLTPAGISRRIRRLLLRDRNI